MSWLRIDDGFAENPKIADLADRTFRLHVVALCYCARNLTDGLVTARALRVLAAIVGVNTVAKNVSQLVDAGLWMPLDGGDYTIKDYLEYNPTAEKVKEERARNAARQRKHRDERNEGGNALRNGVTNTAPARPLPLEQKTSKATPVDNSREEQLTESLVYMDSIGFQGRPRLEALALGPSMMDEAIRRTRSRQDVDNPAAYFTTVTRNLLAVQRAWKSDMPLEERLETYVRNAGHEYMNHDLAQELQWKGADRPMIARLLVKADEIRQEAA
jgi:hypothetical protein